MKGIHDNKSQMLLDWKRYRSKIGLKDSIIVKMFFQRSQVVEAGHVHGQ